MQLVWMGLVSHLVVGLEIIDSGALPLELPSLLLYNGRDLELSTADWEDEGVDVLEAGGLLSSMPLLTLSLSALTMPCDVQRGTLSASQ